MNVMSFKGLTSMTSHLLLVALIAAYAAVSEPALSNKRTSNQSPSLVKLDTLENDAAEKESATPKPLNKSALPSVDQLIEAKISALKNKQDEQEKELAQIEASLLKEQTLKNNTFDDQAYFSLSVVNNAPSLDYRLDGTEVYVDGTLIARGGKRNQGLPRQKEVYFGAVEPGCHEVLIKAKYTRLKNDLISRFKVNRIERITKSQAFIAQKGHRIELLVEGFEAHNTFFNWYRGPAIRFNKSARPNFLPGAPIVSMDEVLKQGRVKITYKTEDNSTHRLIKKSVSIDGLPILVDEQHDDSTMGDVLFDAPLREGKHTLNVTLLFAEKKWINGGPNYNFRLNFDRAFTVLSGQSTPITVVGMPHGGIRSKLEDTRYAKVTSQVLSQEYKEFFPEQSCQVIKAQSLKSVVPPKEPSKTPKLENNATESLPVQQENDEKKTESLVTTPTEGG